MNHHYLIADIGGTNARMALCSSEKKETQDMEIYSCNTGASLEEVITEYLQLHVEKELAGVCLAVPGPVEGGTFSFVNNDWVVDPKHLETILKAPVFLLNDFSAQSLALAAMSESDFDWMDQVRASSNLAKALVGPGTGTGVGALMASGQVIPSEAGHIGFAPITGHQEKLHHYARKKFGRVSVERLISGPGLVNIYQFNQEQNGLQIDPSTHPSDIATAAENGEEIANRSIQDFWDILAAYSGDIALTFGAKGGVFISGGAAQKLSPFLDTDRFREIFSDKGRFKTLCSEIPLGICTEQQMGLLGCRQYLIQKGV